jgi:DNA-binding IclR family transcriptional regulator
VIEEELDGREPLVNEVLRVLGDHPEGLRMVEIAEMLGVENWRSLITVMKKLVDGGNIRKDDSTYYIV